MHSAVRPDLNELTVCEDLKYSGNLFHNWGAQKLKSASLFLVLENTK